MAQTSAALAPTGVLLNAIMLGIEITFSREGGVGARMIRISAARHGSANLAPRPHRDGRIA
jgi:hypothetical protein